jgi:hypothetical protein
LVSCLSLARLSGEGVCLSTSHGGTPQHSCISALPRRARRAEPLYIPHHGQRLDPRSRPRSRRSISSPCSSRRTRRSSTRARSSGSRAPPQLAEGAVTQVRAGSLQQQRRRRQRRQCGQRARHRNARRGPGGGACKADQFSPVHVAPAGRACLAASPMPSPATSPRPTANALGATTCGDFF